MSLIRQHHVEIDRLVADANGWPHDLSDEDKRVVSPARATTRCAIYTRKPTDEGLEQEFNSLDAQREACAAYFLSQRHEGWTLLPDTYDDGGFSGGTMDRPGLRQLRGRIRDGQGRAMRPSHASKGSVCYRFYKSFEDNGQASTLRAERIAAGDLEPLVLTAIRQLLIDRSALVGLLGQKSDAEATVALLVQAKALARTIDTGLPLGQRVLLDELDLQVVIEGQSLRSNIGLDRLAVRLGIEPEAAAERRHPLMIAARPPRRGREIRLIVSGNDEVPIQRDGRLVMLLLKAQAARRQLLTTDASVTSPSIYSDKHVARLARLSWLAPDIVSAILEGKHPRSLTARQLLRASEVPLAWTDQRRMFGFA